MFLPFFVVFQWINVDLSCLLETVEFVKLGGGGLLSVGL